MSRGYVYMMVNPSMPGMVKVGKTTRDPKMRAKSLYGTSVPTPFEIVEAVLCRDCHSVERRLHEMLSDFRVSASREFFRTTDAKDALALCLRVSARVFDEAR